MGRGEGKGGGAGVVGVGGGGSKTDSFQLRQQQIAHLLGKGPD